jgi:tetratricopeptide (TPR) repeat protein
MADSVLKIRELDKVIRGYIKLEDTGTIKKEMLPSVDLNSLPVETLIKLSDMDCLDFNKLSAHNRSKVINLLEQDTESIRAATKNIKLCIKAALSGEFNKALQFIDKALIYKPTDALCLFFRGHTLMQLQRYKEAFETNERGLLLLKDNPELLKQEKMLSTISTALFLNAINNAESTRKLMDETGITERFFPLARAIDYLQSGKPELIEKLSPEVRGVVEEIVAKMRQVDSRTNKLENKSRARKPKSSTRRRTRKQLH